MGITWHRGKIEMKLVKYLSFLVAAIVAHEMVYAGSEDIQDPFAVAMHEGSIQRMGTDDDTELSISIKVTNLDTGLRIEEWETLTSVTPFQVTVTTNGLDCAGQFVVTALGAPGAPPAVLVQAVPFIIGPAVGSNSVSGEPLDSGGDNDWKISASCNGDDPVEHDFDFFEFFVLLP
jgi:hypothetical protein